MGRTLHYNFKPKNGRFTAKELEKLYDVGKIYLERCEWTCEAINIRPYDIYPNWKGNCTWELLEKRWSELVEQGLHPNKISQTLVKEKIANSHQSSPQLGFYGFTKTGGNELNSLQVVSALFATSKVVKNASVSLNDEGELLKCPITIENGLAMPDEDRIDSDTASLLYRALFDEVYSDLAEDFKGKAKALYDNKKQFKHLGDNRYMIDGKPRWEISDCCRPIDPADFENHPEYGAGQIMAGFEGEYFGLAKKDAEAESYRMIASLQKLLPNDVTMQVAPKLNTLTD